MRVKKNVFGKLFRRLTFEDIKDRDSIFLYAGDIPKKREYDIADIVGLSLNRSDYRTIMHNICDKYPLPDDSVNAYQAEDVFEHIEYDKLVDVINEIYRVLKHGSTFRLSVPDYGCDILYDRSVKDTDGKIIFDPGGGGIYKNGKVLKGGHVWFPTYEKIEALIEKSNFGRYEFYHYYDKNGGSVTKKIDYSKGYIQRTPDHDERVREPYRAMSLVVDLFKD